MNDKLYFCECFSIGEDKLTKIWRKLRNGTSSCSGKPKVTVKLVHFLCFLKVPLSATYVCSLIYRNLSGYQQLNKFNISLQLNPILSSIIFLELRCELNESSVTGSQLKSNLLTMNADTLLKWNTSLNWGLYDTIEAGCILGYTGPKMSFECQR